MYQEIFDGNLVKLSEESLAFTLVNWNGESSYTYYLLYVILYTALQINSTQTCVPHDERTDI